MNFASNVLFKDAGFKIQINHNLVTQKQVKKLNKATIQFEKVRLHMKSK